MKLAIEGGSNGVVATFGCSAPWARKYVHKIPFVVKINHSELLTLPTQPRRGHCQCPDLFRSDESTLQITEITEACAHA